MTNLELKDYFTTNNQERALEAYGDFAKSSAWLIETKIDLYGLSREAFSGNGNFSAFKSIYKNLVGSWQVFRPHGAEQCWDAEKIFTTVRQRLSEFSHSSGENLTNFDEVKKSNLAFGLMALNGIKPNAAYPTMTASKFLHFFNPSLFPIYDTMAVKNKVFARFRNDFIEFCRLKNLDSSATDAKYLCNYILWASSLLKAATPDFMRIFIAWLQSVLPPKSFSSLDPVFLRSLYATAFEFTAIGAARAEGY